MAVILNIDVSGKDGLVALAKDGVEVGSKTNTDPMEHASFLQPAIVELLESAKLPINAVDAVALSNGPGSYTGLRVGLASAKGLCYALSIPLITVNTLQVMAFAAQLMRESNDDNNPEKDISNVLGQKFPTGQTLYYCPMIDARRMEVFFGLYSSANEPVILPKNEILSPLFLEEYLQESLILFTGSGVEKWKKICRHSNARYLLQPKLNQAICLLSFRLYNSKYFADLASTEPEYCKPFYDTARN